MKKENKRVNHLREIEKKLQKEWENEKIFESTNVNLTPNLYDSNISYEVFAF